jgi:hypothetical protein
VAVVNLWLLNCNGRSPANQNFLHKLQWHVGVVTIWHALADQRTDRTHPKAIQQSHFARGHEDVGGVLDAIGGGWGQIVTSTLIGHGHVPRLVIGSVNLTEFFVTIASSAAFVLTLGFADLVPII